MEKEEEEEEKKEDGWGSRTIDRSGDEQNRMSTNGGCSAEAKEKAEDPFAAFVASLFRSFFSSGTSSEGTHSPLSHSEANSVRFDTSEKSIIVRFPPLPIGSVGAVGTALFPRMAALFSASSSPGGGRAGKEEEEEKKQTAASPSSVSPP